MTGRTAGTFEGSYLGDGTRISDAAEMECKICWTPYRPEEGDEMRQVPPGTPFRALPADWTCPTCDAPKTQFMVLRDPAMEEKPDPSARMNADVAALVAEFREIHAANMRNTPLTNESLHVEAVGFREWEGHFLGVLIAPWFMNLTLLPGPGMDWSQLRTGEKELVAFPSGHYEFIHMQRDRIGGYKACSLFSPMSEFASQLYATDVARAVMAALFDDKIREETDQALTQRRLREAELAAAEAAAVPKSAPAAGSRRALITGSFTARGAEAP